MMIQISGCIAPGSTCIVRLEQPQEHECQHLYAQHADERPAEPAAHGVVTRVPGHRAVGARRTRTGGAGVVGCCIRKSLQGGSGPNESGSDSEGQTSTSPGQPLVGGHRCFIGSELYRSNAVGRIGQEPIRSAVSSQRTISYCTIELDTIDCLAYHWGGALHVRR